MHSLCHAAVAIMAVTSVSFHQASPSLLQRPFPPPPQCSLLSLALSPPIPHLHPSVKSFFNLIFNIFFLVHPVLVWDENVALLNVMRQEKGVCSSACHTRGSKSSTAFTAQFTQSKAASRLCLLSPKPRLHTDYIAVSSYFGFLTSKNIPVCGTKFYFQLKESPSQ